MNNDFRVDLHCHSTCSDGQLTPIELLRLAAKIGLQGLSITDHDTIAAYSQETLQEAASLGLNLCSGVEFSCQCDDTNVHLLGYNFDITSQPLHQLCLRHKERRRERNAKILKKLAAKGMFLNEEDLVKKIHTNVIGRPHIAYLMIEKGYVKSIDEAFRFYLGDGKCCFDPGEAFSVDETIEVIHSAQGKVFIAHPHLIRKNRLVRELLKKPIDGIECYYGLFRLQDNQRWLTLAQEHQLLVSGGSDFHGDLKPYIPLGASWVDQDTFNKIMQKT
jgi:predicted metal-dependent phosphoesterase TrpH